MKPPYPFIEPESIDIIVSIVVLFTGLFFDIAYINIVMTFIYIIHEFIIVLLC